LGDLCNCPIRVRRVHPCDHAGLSGLCGSGDSQTRRCDRSERTEPRDLGTMTRNCISKPNDIGLKGVGYESVKPIFCMTPGMGRMKMSWPLLVLACSAVAFGDANEDRIQSAYNLLQPNQTLYITIQGTQTLGRNTTTIS